MTKKPHYRWRHGSQCWQIRTQLYLAHAGQFPWYIVNDNTRPSATIAAWILNTVASSC